MIDDFAVITTNGCFILKKKLYITHRAQNRSIPDLEDGVILPKRAATSYLFKKFDQRNGSRAISKVGLLEQTMYIIIFKNLASS